jgi:hypothetical protein
VTAGTIVVVGGSGAVGRELVGLLAGGPDEVVVVGRDGRRAAAVAAEAARRSGGQTSARQADVTRTTDRRSALFGATTVVTCVDGANGEVARDALDEGAHVVDISASASVLAGIAALDARARWNGRTAITGVGLAPGLTNVLARACVDRIDDPERVDIAVLLGLGEHHGTEAIRWTVEALTAPAARPTTELGSTDRPARVRLPGFGERRAHPFPFADQAALRASLGIPVTTRLCFDSRMATAAAFALRPLLRTLPTGALVWAAGRTHFGSDRWGVTVTATGADGATVTGHASGARQAHATALMTAHVVRQLGARATPPGAHSLEAAVDVAGALAALAAAGVVIRLGGAAAHDAVGGSSDGPVEPSAPDVGARPGQPPSTTDGMVGA